MNPEEHGIDPAYLSENDRKMLSATAEVEDSAAQPEAVKAPMTFDELEELLEVMRQHYDRADMLDRDSGYLREAQAAIIEAEPVLLQGLQDPATQERALTLLREYFFNMRNGALHRLPEFFREFIGQHISLLEKIMEGEEEGAQRLAFEVAYLMFRSSEAGVDREVFLRHLETIKRLFIRGFIEGWDRLYSEIVALLLERSLEVGDMETLRDVGWFIVDEIDNMPMDTGESLLLKISEWFSQLGKIGDIAYDIVMYWLEKHELDFNHLYDTAWGTVEQSQQGHVIGANLQRIKQIESIAPGSAKVLLQRFGIKHFGRYPSEMLLEQHWERDNAKLRYGIILYPTHDHNSAFHQDVSIFRDMYNDIKGEFAVRIVECEGKFDIGRTFINLDKRYGQSHKIAFAIIGGHGNEESISFGGYEPRHQLHVADLVGRGVGKTVSFFEPNPPIVLISCSTGAKDAIGQQLSALAGAKLIAPEIPTNVDSIVGTVNEGKIDFTVKYNEPGSDRIYTAGVRADSR